MKGSVSLAPPQRPEGAVICHAQPDGLAVLELLERLAILASLGHLRAGVREVHVYQDGASVFVRDREQPHLIRWEGRLLALNLGNFVMEQRFPVRPVEVN